LQDKKLSRRPCTPIFGQALRKVRINAINIRENPKNATAEKDRICKSFFALQDAEKQKTTEMGAFQEDYTNG